MIGPAPPPLSAPARWCCVYKDVEEVEGYEGSDLQFEVIGRKMAPKECRALETRIDAFIQHSHATVIQRRSLTFVAVRTMLRARVAGRLLQSHVRCTLIRYTIVFFPNFFLHEFTVVLTVLFTTRAHYRTSHGGAARLQAAMRRRQQHGKCNTALRASQLQRAWRAKSGR